MISYLYLLEIKQQSNVRLSKKQLKLKCLKMEKKLNSRMLFPKTVEDGDNKEMINADCFFMENVRILQKLGSCFEETTLAITGTIYLSFYWNNLLWFPNFEGTFSAITIGIERVDCIIFCALIFILRFKKIKDIHRNEER